MHIVSNIYANMHTEWVKDVMLMLHP